MVIYLECNWKRVGVVCYIWINERWGRQVWRYALIRMNKYGVLGFVISGLGLWVESVMGLWLCLD